MFEDIYETPGTGVRLRDGGLPAGTLSNSELLAEAGLPARAIREILARPSSFDLRGCEEEVE